MDRTGMDDVVGDGALRVRGTVGYGADASELVEQYESVSFREVHRDVLHLLPEMPCRVLDVGSGSGRDAAALAALGHVVVAVEPTPELRESGQRVHAGAWVEWVDDSLPGLGTLRGPFELVLLTAVWMHLDPAERAAGMQRLGELVVPGGRMVLVLRHGPVPAGRLMWDVSAAETVELGGRFGFVPVWVGERGDPHGRGGVSWSVVVMDRVSEVA
ncbi:class I SAM-dependent methyltransferase [Embleya sp. AB8]|uniref:class I SAM-dependent methyltransferase n=1 Tax=Embleya sp. AB8 TaxID=3156304 RepID=UPI003C73A53D